MVAAVETMFSVVETPWHGLGKILRDPPTIEQGIIEAGLDWDVKLVDLYRQENGTGKPTHPVKHKAVVRVTDDQDLGVVGPGYRPLQNRDAFKWFEPFLESGLVTLETAGSLHSGSKIWVLARVKDSEMEVLKHDSILMYLLLTTSHDGTTATYGLQSNIRVVCANTLAIAMSSARNAVGIRHSDRQLEKLALVQESIKHDMEDFKKNIEMFQHLAKSPMSDPVFDKYLENVIPFRTPLMIDEPPRPPRAIEQIKTQYRQGPGAEIPGVQGTFWGGYNAITSFTDHVRGRSQENRLASNWFGDSARLKKRALDIAIQMAA